METVKRSVVSRVWGVGECVGRAQEIFRAVKILCMIL